MKKQTALLLAVLAIFPIFAQEPDSAEYWNDRGELYLSENEFEKAIEDFSKAIAIKPDFVTTLENRGWAYYNMGEYDLAIADYNMAITLDPDFAPAWNGLGNVHGSKGEVDRAIEDYSKAIVLNPNYINAWSNRGNAYKDKGELDRAIEDYNKVIILDPNYIAVLNYRGVTYASKEELDRAIEDFSKAITVNPNYTTAWGNRGIAYRDKGELDRAIEDFSKALALDTNYTTAWNNRGIAYRSKGELDRAIEDFNKALALDSSYTDAWNNRGNAYSSKGNFDLAIEDYSKAIVLNPSNPFTWINRGTAYYYKDKFDHAITDFNKAIALDPNSTGVWNNRGLAYLHTGELDLAIEDFSKAIALTAYKAFALNNRGNAFMDKGDLDRAMFDFRQSIEAADRSNNALDIFFQSCEFTGRFYKDYPLFDDRKTANESGILLADLARESIKRSIAKAEKARSTLGYRGAGIMASLIYQYYAGADLEASFGSSEEAYNYSEGLRSRGFLEQMGTEAALKLPGIDPINVQEVRDLINEINNLQKLLYFLDPQSEAGRYAETGLALSKAENSLSSLDAKISVTIPRYAELRNPKPADLSQAQEWCGTDRAILEYVLWDSTVEFKAPSSSRSISSYQERPAINSYCFVITKDAIVPVRLDSDFDYAGEINALRNKIYAVDNFTGLPSNEEGAFEKERNELYNALVKPALQYITDHIKELVIVPDGTLGHLPFDILRENEDSLDLGETYRLSLSPSVSVSVLASKTGHLQSVPIVAFGGALYARDKTAIDRGQRASPLQLQAVTNPVRTWDDLPGTVTEVKNLQALVSSPQNIRVFLGGDVSEAEIKKLSGQGELTKYPILHFACHGYFDEADAEKSGIVLSEVSGLIDTGEDGYLTIPEIVLLDLNARMVLLSACETGLGTLKRGDGMVGMARAFLVSGVENVGVSLWSISDAATVEFMTRLYTKVLNEGKTFKEAYYLVKDEFRKDARWGHPYYWAAFTMYE